MNISPLAGKPAPASILVNVPRLVTAYYTEVPDPSVPEQRVIFGTSGHRGSSFTQSFNEWHILAISQAICLYRKQHQIDGPLFLGMDTHALSVPAMASALGVLAANGVEVMLAEGNEYTPTPAVSHAILTYNRGRKIGLADGIVITPSHNPPHDGASNTILQTVGRPRVSSRIGFRRKQTNPSKPSSKPLKGYLSIRLFVPPRRIGTTTSVPISMISPTCSTWRPFVARSSAWGWIPSEAPGSTIGSQLPSGTD
jgi:hypothetical protein